MYLSWVIPTYKEERRIEKTVREVAAYLRGKKFPGGYEIIVADSSSPDRTEAIVLGLKKEIPALQLLRVENKGKGWGVKQGMLAAQGEIRLFSDADNSTPPQSLDNMLPFFVQGYDIVISSRDPKDAPGASRDVEEPWYREIMGNAGNFMIQLVGGAWGIWDTQNGFKALTALATEEIFSRIRMNGFSFDIEMIALSRRLEFKLGIIPVKWKFDPDSKVTLKDYFRVLADVFKIRWNLITNKYRMGEKRLSKKSVL